MEQHPNEKTEWRGSESGPRKFGFRPHPRSHSTRLCRSAPSLRSWQAILDRARANVYPTESNALSKRSRSRGRAHRRAHAPTLTKWTRAKKLALANGRLDRLHQLAKRGSGE